MSSRTVAAWVWALFVAGTWVAISAYQPNDLTPFGIPAAMTLLLGTLVFTRVPGNPIGLVMMVAGSAWLFYDGFRQYALLSLESGPFRGEYLTAWIGTWTGPVFFAGFPALLLLFPNGEARGWRRWALLAVALIPLAAFVGGVRLWGVPVEVLLDDDLVSTLPEYQLVDLAFILGLYLAIPATVSIVLRFRVSDRIGRQQIKWLLAGSVAFSVGLLVGLITSDDATSAWWLIVVVTGMSLFPISVGVAIFRYRLYDLGRIVSRTLAYALSAGLLGLGVFAAAAGIGAQFEAPPVVAATTLGVAAVFNPVRRWMQGLLDRHFNRSHYDAERVVSEFAGSLRDEVDVDEVVYGWVGVVDATLQPASINVWVRS